MVSNLTRLVFETDVFVTHEGLCCGSVTAAAGTVLSRKYGVSGSAGPG